MNLTSDPTNDELRQLEDVKRAFGRIRAELGKVVIGQDAVIEQLLLAIFAQGHCLLEGVPGLAKTLLVSTLARSLRLKFNRIQFTPDLMPSDITGTTVLDESSGKRDFRFVKGPIFANIVLADEINRTPPKTQAALLEAMQERQVTIGGRRHPLPAPFFVLATQNPIEQEGTYTLPEAQQDRFMFKVFVKYPSYDEEYRVADVTTSDHVAEVAAVLSGEDLTPLQHLVRRVPAPPHVIHYALRLVRSTRVHEADGVPEFIREWVSWGSGPRGVQYLLLGAKARTVLNGRFSVTTDDIKAVVHPVLRHRVIPNFSADSAGMNTDKILDQLLKETPERHPDDAIAPAWERAFMANP